MSRCSTSRDLALMWHMIHAPVPGGCFVQACMQCDTPHCSWTVTSAVQATSGQHALVSSCITTDSCHNKSLLGGRNADLGCHEVQGTSKARGPHQLQEPLQRLDIDVDEHQGCTEACCSRKRNAILQRPAALLLGAMPAGANRCQQLQQQEAVGGESVPEACCLR